MENGSPCQFAGINSLKSFPHSIQQNFKTTKELIHPRLEFFHERVQRTHILTLTSYALISKVAHLPEFFSRLATVLVNSRSFMSLPPFAEIVSS